VNCPICGNDVYEYKGEPGFYCRNAFCTFDDDLVDEFLAQIGPIRSEVFAKTQVRGVDN